MHDTGTKAVYIAPALAANNRNILIQSTTGIIQVLRHATGYSLGILKRSNFTICLRNISNSTLIDKVAKVIRKAQWSRSDGTQCMTYTCKDVAGCRFLNFLDLGILSLLIQHIIDRNGILSGLLSFGIPQIAKSFLLLVVPSFIWALLFRFITLCFLRHFKNLAATYSGEGGITSNITKVPQKRLPPLLFLRCAFGFLCLLLLICHIIFPACLAFLLMFCGIVAISKLCHFLLVGLRLLHGYFEVSFRLPLGVIIGDTLVAGLHLGNGISPRSIIIHFTLTKGLGYAP